MIFGGSVPKIQIRDLMKQIYHVIHLGNFAMKLFHLDIAGCFPRELYFLGRCYIDLFREEAMYVTEHNSGVWVKRPVQAPC